MDFQLVGPIHDIEIIAVGRGVRDRARLTRLYGPGRWFKLKGFVMVRRPAGNTRHAEVHWYQAHGIGRRELKVKRLLP